MQQRKVIIEHITSYEDPIVVYAGDILTLGRKDNWDGHIWIWATASNSKQGWVPDNLCHEANDQFIASYDYSAVELTCKIGEIVTEIRQRHGWAWCKLENGNGGWIPLRNLGP